MNSSCPRSSSTTLPSALRLTQRRAVDVHRVAVVPQPAEQSLHHGPVAEEIGPLVIAQVGGDDGGVMAIPLFHQLEEDIRLLGLEVQIAKFVDQDHVQTGQPFEELA